MICKVCFMDCNTTIEQKAHERKHENIYSCHFCSSKFASEYHCQMHFNDHMKLIKPNECRYCGKRFYNETSLVIHMHHHLNVKCHICGLVFEDDIIFLKHMNGHGKKKLELFMKNVNKFDEDESNLEALLNFYNNRTNSVLLKTKYFNSDSDILDCVDNMVSSISHVINLVPKHVSWANKCDMSCHICKVGKETTKDLLEHYNESHPRNRTCVFCGRRSKSVSMTRRHVVTHLKTDKVNSGADTEDKNIVLSKNNGGNSLECVICLKKFATKGKRNYHMLLVHKKILYRAQGRRTSWGWGSHPPPMLANNLKVGNF
ncbi:unnamed protein product, partial [Timema podura]|nr:unnamed protein product [Timema podura]